MKPLLNLGQAIAKHRAALFYAVAVGFIGYVLMDLPIGQSYYHDAHDFLHHFIRLEPKAEPKVAVIKITEKTRSELKTPMVVGQAGVSVSRLKQAELLRKLVDVGVAGVCYDLHFIRPAEEPRADETFHDAIAYARSKNVPVVIGSVARVHTVDRGYVAGGTTPTLDSFVNAGAKSGLTMATRDPGQVNRAFLAENPAQPSLASVAAYATARRTPRLPDAEEGAYYTYPSLSSIQVRDFSDCIADKYIVTIKDKQEEKVLIRSLLRNHVVFIGEELVSHSEEHKEPDFFFTPPLPWVSERIPGVMWHAIAYLNIVEEGWLYPIGWLGSLIASLLLPVYWLVLRVRHPEYRWGVLPWLAIATVTAATGFSAFGYALHSIAVWLPLLLLQFPLLALGTALLPTPLPPPITRSTFISLVNDEFRCYTSDLRKGLNRPRFPARAQTDMTESGLATTLKLDAYIRDCSAMIHLCGDLTGSSPSEAHFRELAEQYPALFRIFPDLEDLLKDGHVPSYTQIEAYMAVVHGIRYVLIATPSKNPPAERESKYHDFSPEERSLQRALQDAHLVRLRKKAKRYVGIEFENAKDLVTKINIETDYWQYLKAPSGHR